MFAIGDTIWKAFAQKTPLEKPCPICYTKRNVTLILGNDDQVVLPCNYCARGYMSPTGYVTEWEYIAEPQPHVVTGLDILKTVDGEAVTYICGSCHFESDCVFEKKEDAMKLAKEMADKEAKDQITRADSIKKDKHKSFSWNAGYHLRNAKKLEKDILYHKKMAVICKERSKKGCK